MIKGITQLFLNVDLQITLLGRKMRVQKYNFPDTVIWNPWIDQAKEIPDYADDEYPNMISVQAGHVTQPLTLMPQTAFEASQILQVM